MALLSALVFSSCVVFREILDVKVSALGSLSLASATKYYLRIGCLVFVFFIT